MAPKPIPRQPDFTVEKEEWGHVQLEDGSIIDLKFVLIDLVIASEDLLGPQITLGHTVAVRSRSPLDLMSKVKDKPVAPEIPPPIDAASGYEMVKIIKIEKPIRSSYFFEEYLLVVELNVQGVVKNMRYKSQNGAPLYNVRWTMRYSLQKAVASTKSLDSGH